MTPADVPTASLDGPPATRVGQPRKTLLAGRAILSLIGSLWSGGVAKW